MKDIRSLIRDHDALCERFYEKVDDAGNCHKWTSAVDTANGYGRITIGGYSAKAHRVALILDGEEILGKKVLHSCDNKLCVNPEHLRLGDTSDNRQDQMDVGTHVNQKLSRGEVEEIREKYENSDVIQSELAEEYGVGQDQISRIVNRKAWV